MPNLGQEAHFGIGRIHGGARCAKDHETGRNTAELSGNADQLRRWMLSRRQTCRNLSENPLQRTGAGIIMTLWKWTCDGKVS
jgi:hypothetical protein